MDYDLQLRLAAFAELTRLRDTGNGVVTREQLETGFEFEGERIGFYDPRRGIWRPKQLGSDGAALTIVTAPHKPGREPAYDDQIASDDGWLVYRYEGTDPDTWTNVALRRAMVLERPLIYLYGITPGVYDAIFPCYVVDDQPGQLSFHIVADLSSVSLEPRTGVAEDLMARRQYTTASVKKRLHQHRFRELVLNAYRVTCAVCRLRHRELLDAAHILEDRDERGRPEVRNGMALCKIHHAAYDNNILGVDPDYRVHIRDDILDEHDGPMLQHGLKEMEGGRIILPRSRAKRPAREYLEERYARFRAA